MWNQIQDSRLHYEPVQKNAQIVIPSFPPPHFSQHL